MSYIHRNIHMPTELLMAFSKHTGLFWSGVEIEGAICDVLAAAMQPPPAQAQAHSQTPEVDVINGYQWKQVFLPEGTVLRASFGGQPYYAVVEGSEIKYGKFSLSPSAFANLQGSGNRNAWKAVWLRFPGFKDWIRADECRTLRRTVTARLFEPHLQTESNEPEAKPAVPIGPHQQRYTKKAPMQHEITPLFQLLRDFPEDETAPTDRSDSAPARDEPSRQARPAPNAPSSGKKRSRRQRKAGKNSAKKRHGLTRENPR
ncbi:MAG: hypothetical protein K2X55_26845 [Burkholderiaceae bacterium]|nr:hypothetical protein [Burkholderiaceae bacterium]